MPLANTSASARRSRRSSDPLALVSPQRLEPPRQLAQAALDLLTLLRAEGELAVATPGGAGPAAPEAVRAARIATRIR